MVIVSHWKNDFAIGQVFTTQGLRTFCGITKCYAVEKFSKSQFYRPTAKVGLDNHIKDHKKPVITRKGAFRVHK